MNLCRKGLPSLVGNDFQAASLQIVKSGTCRYYEGGSFISGFPTLPPLLPQTNDSLMVSSIFEVFGAFVCYF